MYWLLAQQKRSELHQENRKSSNSSLNLITNQHLKLHPINLRYPGQNLKSKLISCLFICLFFIVNAQHKESLVARLLKYSFLYIKTQTLFKWHFFTLHFIFLEKLKFTKYLAKTKVIIRTLMFSIIAANRKIYVKVSYLMYGSTLKYKHSTKNSKIICKCVINNLYTYSSSFFPHSKQFETK